MEKEKLKLETLKEILSQYDIEFQCGAYYNYDEEITGYWIDLPEQTISFHKD